MTRLLGKISLLLVAAALGGCVYAEPAPAPYAYAPDYYGYGYGYGYGPAYVAPEVSVGGCFGCGGRHHWR